MSLARVERRTREPAELPRDGRRRLVVARPGAWRRRKGDSPTPEPRAKVKGEGWRSVVTFAVGAGLVSALAKWAGAEAVAAAGTPIALMFLGTMAGKDIGRVADAVVAAVTALRSR